MKTPGVLLISPGIIKWTDMDFGLPHLVSVGGYLQAHLGVRVELLDLNYEGGDHVQLRRTLEELGPFLLIGVSCYSSFDYLRVLTLGRYLRGLYPDTPLVTGGYHASALPGDLAFDGSPFDAVVVGEGELPMKAMVETLLGGGRLDRRVFGPQNVADLDTLPPYQWQLLDRYWPRATDIGKKLQVVLSRGCPYHCTFCMERAKTEYSWRAYSSGRAVEELRRLASFTDLSRWVVNIADPLFGFKRSWRREVLGGILERGLRPRQYWTLTRSDDLDAEDVSLLARARFSIGIGLESGSPRMLEIMQKGNRPERYLEAIQRLATLSREHGLTWATNIIVGHPGETMETMRETRDFLGRLFTSAKDTCGWLSIDPFRLYPGALVHAQMAAWSARHGTRFHHPEWWKSWYDGPFRAQHVDPSTELDYAARVRFMHEAYAPLAAEIAARFRGQGRSVDRVFEKSLAEQQKQLSPEVMADHLRRGERARHDGPSAVAAVVRVPLGLQVREPLVRLREEAVRRLLETGVLRTEALIEALLCTAPERWLDAAGAEALLRETTSPGLRVLAMALEALEPGLGDRVLVLGAEGGYVPAVLAALVGGAGRVVGVHPASWLGSLRLGKALAELAQVTVTRGDPTAPPSGEAPFDRLLVLGALPRFVAPLRAALTEEGRAVAFLGPRFRAQDLALLVRHGDAVAERVIARVTVPVLAGTHGWVATA